MTDTGKGWVIFLAAFGLMLTLEANELTNMKDWSETHTPLFWGKVALHLGTVIGAFVAGKLIPGGK